MELSGEEKRIRASFLELKLEDERVAPQFAAMSNRAHRSGARQQIAFDFRIAAAVVTICFALFSLALLAKRWQPGPRSNYLVTAGAGQSNASQPQIKKEEELVQQRGHAPVVREALRGRRLVAKLQRRRPTTRDTAALARWQSPTNSLLRSPVGGVLQALPQLNQTLEEMKSFLSESTKLNGGVNENKP
jgi:hypothetical protein